MTNNALKSAHNYSVILSKATMARIETYTVHLNAGESSGAHLSKVFRSSKHKPLDKWQVLSALLNSKKPQIFAESSVYGDGTDWTLDELSILGDISIGMSVSIFDNGAHQNPVVHKPPFTGNLIYTPGALLRNDQGLSPADWTAVTENGEVNKDKYYALYERRLLPAFHYINARAVRNNRPAFITVPGMGCGQFAGPFRGQMGASFKEALGRLIETYAKNFSGIKAVYYDPYNECANETRKIDGIQFIVRPLLLGNDGRSQLCEPSFLGQGLAEDFENCELYSFVAWDHVSWPGNDYYLGSRVTDDGVKAAATNTMQVMTNIEGHYCKDTNMYCAPDPYNNWYQVVTQNNLSIMSKNNHYIV